MNRQIVDDNSDVITTGPLTLEQEHRVERDLDYWKHQLGGELPELNLLLDYPRLTQSSLEAKTQKTRSFWITAEMFEDISSLCSREKITTSILMLTLLKVLLYRYTEQEDIIVGYMVSGRNLPDIEPLIDSCVNTLVMRTQLQSEMTIREALQQVSEVTSEAYNHSIPFDKLVSELNPSTDASTNPYFQVMLNMHPMSMVTEEVPDRVDLILTVTQLAGKLKCSFSYRSDVYKAETILRIAGHYQTLLQGVLVNPQATIATLPILTKREEYEMLVKWNSTQPQYPQGLCVHDIFADQVKLYPQSVAIQYKDKQVTYRELDRRANQIANYLRELGLETEGLVAVCLDRTPDLIATFLGILKAGGAYVPLDITYPTERIEWMLENSKVSFLITTESLARELPPTGAKIIYLDKEANQVAAYSEVKPENLSESKSLAYVMYTSGSTGKPKGVAIVHQGIIRLVKNISYGRMGPEETFLLLAPVSFDASTFEIYSALLNGGKLVIMDSIKPSLGQIAETIRQHRVTFICTGPEVLNLLLEDYSDVIGSLGQILCGGDVLPVWMAHKCLAKLPGCQLINAYGPTENSVVTTCYPVKEMINEASIPIGRPIAGDSVFILDKYLMPVPIGVIGELYVSGAGIAREYLNNDDLTTEKFILNPFTDRPNSKLYKTGDLARYRADRNIEFLGRIDSQVKIRGYRIELGEIETAVSQCPGVLQTVAGTIKQENGTLKLAVYIVMKKEIAFDQQKLRAFAQDRLPQFMVPTFFIELAQIPLTPIGKIDRKSLPAPDLTQNLEQRVLPRNAIEEQLVRIWEKLLGVPSIGVTDNFFDMGGHSLLAMRLFSEMEKVFQKNLPVSLIFKEDTIEKLARLLNSADVEQDLASSIVVMQPHGNKPPIFIIHELDGEVISYRNLVKEFRDDRPIFGLRDTRVEHGSQITINHFAIKYIQEIRAIQSEGPYHLMGFSLGGLIAYEMAQQLNKAGHEVSLLGILDASNPKYYKAQYSFLKTFAKNMKVLVKIPWGQRIPFLIEKLQHVLGEKRLVSTSDSKVVEARAHLLLKAAEAYVPEPYPGKIVIFRAGDDVYNLISDDKNGWESAEGGSIDVYRVPGNHQTLLAETNVKHVGTYLKRYLLGICTLPLSDFDFIMNY
jgi:amino acid adenylation domain-containing protein